MNEADIFSIKNKVIIITGAGRGIGRTFAVNMAKISAYVYCFDINFPTKIPDALSDNLFDIKCDLTNTKKFDMECKKIFASHKKIDVLVNNLGSTAPGKPNKVYSTKNWDQTLKINLSTAFNCSQTIIKFMKKQKNSSIINITSINAELGFPNNPAYVASKGGLKMLGKSLARDWGKYGIRVNNLGPGYFKTLMNKKSWENPKTRKARTVRTMLGRWGEIDELVGPCIFLASDASQYITGQDIYVVYRYMWNGNELVNPILIKSFDGYHTRHHGGVMTSDKANNVYVFKGDGDSKSIYQNYPDSNNFESGIFKIDSNNSIELYAMGVRNSFGLAIDPITQNLWETENGQFTYDEINMINEGFNGGWALNIGPSDRFDSEIRNNLDRINDSEFQDYSYSEPKFSWYDTIGPTAIAFPNFTSFEKYKDWLFVGNSNNGNIYKFQLDVERDDFIFYDTNLSKDLVLDLNDSSDEIIFANIPGIITDIKFNDDGMYVVNYSDGIIYRIYPKEFDSTKTLAIISEDKIDDKEKELIDLNEELDFFTLISRGKIIEASDAVYSFIERNYYSLLNHLFS